MPANDVWEATVVQRLAGQRVVNVFHFKETVGISPPFPARNVAQMFEAEFKDVWRAMVSEDVAFDCCYVRRVQPAPTVPYLLLFTAPNLGLIAEDSIPGNASACLSFHSDLATKNGRGRKYIAGIPEGGQDSGLMDAPQLALCDAFADLFRDEDHAGPDGGTFKACVYSRATLAGEIIKQADFSPSIATMSSRRQPFGMVP